MASSKAMWRSWRGENGVVIENGNQWRRHHQWLQSALSQYGVALINGQLKWLA
jgi:hypothetical protein